MTEHVCASCGTRVIEDDGLCPTCGSDELLIQEGLDENDEYVPLDFNK